MYINFNEKVVLVTGSTSGIGRQIAKQLVESGATVIIHYGHNDSMAEETIKELENYKDNILLIKADLADYTDTKGCIAIKPYGYAILEKHE